MSRSAELIEKLAAAKFKSPLKLGCTRATHLRLGVHAVINARAGRQDLNSHTDKERHMALLAYKINTPRLRVYRTELGELKSYLMKRMPDRFVDPREDW